MTIGSNTVIGAGALLVGEINVGSNVFIAAGETVRESIPDRSVVYHGKIVPAREWRGRLACAGFFDGPQN